MKNKRLIIITIFIFLIILLTQNIYANTVATVKITPDKTSLKQGDQITLKVSVKNTGVNAGIEDVSGFLVYDASSFEIVKTDLNSKITQLNLNQEKQEMLKEFAEDLDILDITTKYIIAGMKDADDYVLSIAAIGEDGIIDVSGTEVPVGEIKLSVKTTMTTTATIKISDMLVNGDQEIGEVATTQLVLNSGGGSHPITPINTVNNIANSVGQPGTVSNKNNNNKVSTYNSSNKIANQAQGEINEAGTEHAWPMFVGICICIGLYINYRRFKEIE